jgi:hypothetical protein
MNLHQLHQFVKATGVLDGSTMPTPATGSTDKLLSVSTEASTSAKTVSVAAPSTTVKPGRQMNRATLDLLFTKKTISGDVSGKATLKATKYASA